MILWGAVCLKIIFINTAAFFIYKYCYRNINTATDTVHKYCHRYINTATDSYINTAMDIYINFEGDTTTALAKTFGNKTPTVTLVTYCKAESKSLEIVSTLTCS